MEQCPCEHAVTNNTAPGVKKLTASLYKSVLHRLGIDISRDSLADTLLSMRSIRWRMTGVKDEVGHSSTAD